MFDTDLDRNPTSSTSRRTFLIGAGSTLAWMMVWGMRAARPASANESPTGEQSVTIVEYSDDGKRLKKTRVAKVVKSEDEWRKLLPPSAFSITRHADTEIAYSGEYWNLHDHGLFRCVCCNNALFSSETKFDSGTGWPSFWAPLAKENVREVSDTSYGMVRTAVSCTQCDAHLGHVFDDGPRPTGLRYCMNSASLKFIPKPKA